MQATQSFPAYYQLHQFLFKRAFYPLLLASALAIATLAGRFYLHRSLEYRFMAWNLLLAWVPYLCSLWAAASHARAPREWWRLVLPAAIWLVFFPNAPYILTDLIHLRYREPLVWWYDVGMLIAFAWAGCFLAVSSLHTMQLIATNFVGRIAGWLLVLGTMLLSGFGIYLGRVQRWNSWDLLLNPRGVLADLMALLWQPHERLQPLGIALLFAALLFVCYTTTTAQRREL